MGSDFGQISKDIVADDVPKQMLPFCFVRILPKYVDSIRTIQEAVRWFEEKDQLFLQISEKIREKVFDRERLLSRLKELKNFYLYRHNENTAVKMGILYYLYLALDNFSFANKHQRGRAINSCTTQEKFDNKELNFRMQHGSRNLAEEKQLLRDVNMYQKTDDASSSPQSQLMRILPQIPSNCSCYSCEYKHDSCDNKLLKEIRNFEVTRKNSAHLKESIKKQVKITSEELMEMRKKTRAPETKIKHVEKKIEAINEEIWSLQKHLKHRNYRKDAYVCILQEMKIENYWVLKYGNLEYESAYFHTIYLGKS